LGDREAATCEIDAGGRSLKTMAAALGWQEEDPAK
jgi:hypothetical protein